MAAVELRQNSILLRRAGDHGRADRLEAAAVVVDSLAAPGRAARPRLAAGATAGDVRDHRGDAAADRLCARRTASFDKSIARLDRRWRGGAPRGRPRLRTAGAAR